MTKKKDRHKQQTTHSQKGKGVNWDLVWKVLASVFAFAGSLATVYDLVGKIRSDTQTFFAFVVPGLVIIVWLIILVQLIRKKNPYVIPLLAVTILGGVVGAIGWQSYNQTQEDKVIVLVAQFDGPEETYGLHNQIMEDLRQATKGYCDTLIVEGKEVVTSGQGSEYARELGEKIKADLVIWAWYRPTDNPNVNIHIENISQQLTGFIEKSSSFQPVITLADLESFTFQQQLGSETTALINFLAGSIHFQSRDYSAAIPLFNKSISALTNTEIPFVNNPTSLYYYRGTSYIYLKQYSQSINDLTKAIGLDPKFSAAFVNRGVAYKALKQYDQALSDFSTAINLDPKRVTAYNNRGSTYATIGQYDQALTDFSKATELDPQLSAAYHNRGLVYVGYKQYQQAIIEFSNAIKIDPQYTSAFINRGNVYADLQQYDQALDDYSKAIELSPQEVLAYYNRGNVFIDLKQYDRAIDDYSKAIDLDPLYASAYVNRGSAYAYLKQFGLSVADYSKAIALDPQNAEVYQGRGHAYQELGKTAEAEADFKKYEELTGKKP